MRKLRHDEIPRPDPAEIELLPKHPISVILDNVRSIHNVGSIFRTSDAAFVEHLYLTGITGTPDHRGVHKTALGAQDTVRWSYEAAPASVVSRLQAEGYTIGVLEITSDPISASQLDATHFPLCLVVGNEVHGVSESLIEVADVAIEIPQFGAKQSLNVSVAYGIAVFDLVRRYRQLEKIDLPPRWDVRSMHGG